MKGLVFFAMLLGVASAASADENPATGSDPSQSLRIESFTAPVLKHIAAPDCYGGARGGQTPAICEKIQQGQEGWVELNLMVDPSGKPFEVTVIRSSGNKDFEESAVKAVAASNFAPGTVDGKAAESDYAFKFVFAGADPAIGARSDFTANYKVLLQAINAHDKEKADAAMKRMQVQNLYENAYAGMASYLYEKQWGNEHQQLAGLLRAIAEENRARYLPKDMFRGALLECFRLQVNQKLYAEALATFDTLGKIGLDDATAARLKPVVEQLGKLRDDATRYELNADLPDGSWGIALFKRNFTATVSTGLIEQIKLRCQKKFVSFAFDPDLEYHVPAQAGKCHMQLIGAPGTRVRLAQF